jgi:hypothetical protein
MLNLWRDPYVKGFFLKTPPATGGSFFMRGRQKPKPPRRTRGLSKFKRTDLTKAAKATLAAGLPVRGIDVDPATGKITVLVGQTAEATGNDLDNWLRKKDAHSA